jgi:hypothetical protein
MLLDIEFFVGDTSLGKSQIDSEYRDASIHLPWSVAYFCPVCGEIWARCRVTHEGSLRDYMVWTRKCANHSTPFFYEFPGSMWLDWDHKWQEAATMPLLIREFELHARHWEDYDQH